MGILEGVKRQSSRAAYNEPKQQCIIIEPTGSFDTEISAEPTSEPGMFALVIIYRCHFKLICGHFYFIIIVIIIIIIEPTGDFDTAEPTSQSGMVIFY